MQRHQLQMQYACGTILRALNDKHSRASALNGWMVKGSQGMSPQQVNDKAFQGMSPQRLNDKHSRAWAPNDAWVWKTRGVYQHTTQQQLNGVYQHTTNNNNNNYLGHQQLRLILMTHSPTGQHNSAISTTAQHSMDIYFHINIHNFSIFIFIYNFYHLNNV